MPGLTPEEREALQAGFDNLDYLLIKEEEALEALVESLSQLVDGITAMFLPQEKN